MSGGVEVEVVGAVLEAQAFDDLNGTAAIVKRDGGGRGRLGGQRRHGTEGDNNPPGRPAGAGRKREFHGVVGPSG